MKTLLSSAALGCALSVAACGPNAEDGSGTGGTSAGSGGTSALGATELLAEVQTNGYRDWYRPPGWEERVTSSAPHGGAVDLFVNDVVENVLRSDDPWSEWPLGSLIVKDGYSGDTQVLTAIMHKREDGWFYAEYDRAGAVDFEGHPALCINCHASGSDFVRAFELPR